MRVRIDYPMGGEGWELRLDMPQVPRAGDDVCLYTPDGDEVHYAVRVVIWTPQDEGLDAIVVLKP